ncbi:pepsin/retropepsin-like aspartic protease family protein [Stenotrophomonas oahuensis]|uniref:Pepsin/retropepsin-like aspartic protease family protein n=1 Tax=Stenotrophomonas oahuensis TaxID=3003271 RepID=A0ABY9YUP6_9GAMM|nr:pepsin/retropepsin-like aspartic protease family protein [Stenotrophomonas sp. A5586]WNH54408.1 pepsin/retropepsin-like aspartic protease family protein [Stenotrophomonas sp. A5586]
MASLSLLTAPAVLAKAPSDACRLAGVATKDATVHQPFQIVDGRIYVQATVNGSGPYRFAVDTGASGMGRLDESLVALMGLQRHGVATTSDGVNTAEVDTTRIQSLSLGALVHRDLELITRNYNKRNSPEAAFHGILGREFFGNGLLVIDYPRRILSFTQRHAISPSDKNALPYERAFRIPVTVAGHALVAQLDTGANVNLVLPQAVYEGIWDAPLQDAVRSQLTNGQLETWRATLQGPVRVGQANLEDVEIRVSAKFPGPLVGAEALQQSVVLIDQRSKTVAVCR